MPALRAVGALGLHRGFMELPQESGRRHRQEYTRHPLAEREISVREQAQDRGDGTSRAMVRN